MNAVKKSNKEIGDILSKLKDDFIKVQKKKKKSIREQGIELLFHYLFYTTDTMDEGLEGILEVDIENFSLTKKDLNDLIYLANLQVGFADIFHILSAKKLGCKYLFSLDFDFKRVNYDVLKKFKIEIVTEPSVMLQKI